MLPGKTEGGGAGGKKGKKKKEGSRIVRPTGISARGGGGRGRGEGVRAQERNSGRKELSIRRKWKELATPN